MKRIPVKIVMIILLAVDIILCGAFFLIKPAEPETPEEPVKAERKLSKSEIRQIFELSTLDCYYHNVIKMYFPGDFTNQGITIYAEYDGNVRMGIDGYQVSVSEPDEEGVITVKMPNATVLSKDLDENSLGWIGKSDALWGFAPIYANVNNISYEKKIALLTEAQEKMQKTASEDRKLISLAFDRGKKIIEKTLITLGEAAGKEYTVNFVDASANN